MSEFVSLHRITCDCERCERASGRSRPSIDEIVKMIQEADPLLKRDSPEFNAALMLATAALRDDIGQDSGKLAHALNLDSSEVAQWCARLRKSGIWQDGKWGFSKGTEIGTQLWEVEFWLHSLVALGLVESHSGQAIAKPKAKRVKPRKPSKAVVVAEVLAVQRAEPPTPTPSTPPQPKKIGWCVDCYVSGDGRHTPATEEIEYDPLCHGCANDRRKILEAV